MKNLLFPKTLSHLLLQNDEFVGLVQSFIVSFFLYFSIAHIRFLNA